MTLKELQERASKGPFKIGKLYGNNYIQDCGGKVICMLPDENNALLVLLGLNMLPVAIEALAKIADPNHVPPDDGRELARYYEDVANDAIEQASNVSIRDQ